MGIRVAPSVTREAAIAGVLAAGGGTGERLGELGRLGAGFGRVIWPHLRRKRQRY